MQKIKSRLFQIGLTVFLMSSVLSAQDIRISGTGTTLITGDISVVKAKAKNEAIKKAVINAINKVLGANAAKQKNIQDKIDLIIEQIDQFKIDEEIKSSKEGNNYIVKYNLTFSDKDFRSLISDLGIATNTNNIRSSAILVLMDEYFTTPINMKAPLEETTTYSKDKSTLYQENADASGYVDSNEELSYKNNTTVSAKATDKRGYTSSTAKINASDKSTGSASSDYSAGSSSSKSVTSAHNDTEFFQKVIKYQPKNIGPEKQNTTLTALYHVFGEYDLKYLDNDIFKSKYFGNSPITLEKLQNSAELERYALAAYKDQKADYFAIGSTIIVDKGINTATGNHTCDGTIVMKVYSTIGQAENISAGTLNESASGSTADQCKGNIAKKLAKGFGPVIASQIQEYYKKRQMYGKEYTVLLVGKYNLKQRKKFLKIVKIMDGIKNIKKRSNTEYVITFSGEDIETTITDSDELLEMLNIEDASFEGSTLKLCQTDGCQ